MIGHQMKKISILTMVCLWVAVTCAALAAADEVVVGVNVPCLNNPDGKASRVDQEIATLKDLRASGVRVIRTGIAPDQPGIDYAKRIYDAGLKLHWEFGLQYAPGAKQRPWQPDKFPNVWAQYPLSQADPERFRASFQPRLDQLEKMGIQLAAFELTAEINMTPFNGDFPLPGKGTIFGLNDLHHDPEGQQIAKGYLQYLKVLAVLKDIRDHSKLNRHTPIISAGLGSYEFPEGPNPNPAKPGTQTDIVSINATLKFMRANGLDKLADAYGIHVYPWDNGPGQPAAADGRRTRLAKYDLTECKPAGSPDGKPCWITEWGFKSRNKSCPADESGRTALVREMKDAFRPYVQQRKVQALTWYAWIDPVENFGVFRCGGLTTAGKLALSPM
jgi:hypothetical protein